jgi:uncharacterized membrane protein YhaH (DUF805 family)
MDWAYAGPILIGILLTLAIGEIIVVLKAYGKALPFYWWILTILLPIFGVIFFAVNKNLESKVRHNGLILSIVLLVIYIALGLLVAPTLLAFLAL